MEQHITHAQAPDSSCVETAGKASGGLEGLREEIDQIDRQIVDLLAHRKHAVGKVAEIKQEQALAAWHPAREENLITARRTQAVQAGLDPDYVEDLFRTMLRHSRVGQLDTLGRRSVRPGATVLVVGGRGSMGSFFARWFAQSGYRVRILDREDWAEARALAEGAELAMLAVPIDLTPQVAERIAPLLAPTCVLCDITSLKQAPVDAMLKAHRGPVVGLHPLFGPTTSTMDRQITVVSPGREPEAFRWLLEQLTLWGNVLVETSPAEHDEVMGIVQALRHFATFAFGRFLHSRNVPIARTLELSSPIYRLELGMVGRLFAQDPALYAEIVFATPERLHLLRDYVQSLNQNLEMVERGDKAEFMVQFRKVAAWFGPFGDQAMRESTFLIDKLVHRF